MASRSEVFTNAKVVISTSTAAGANDVSNLVSSVELTRTYDLLDDTVMGESAHSRKAGLETATANIEFVQVFSTAGGQLNLDLLLNTLADVSATGSNFLIEVRPANANRGATNPEYSFLAVLESYAPMSGAVGEILKTTVPFQSGGGSVSRSVAST